MQTINPKYIALANHLVERFENQLGVDSTKHLIQLASDCTLQPGEDYTDFKVLYDIAEFAMNKHIHNSLQLHHTLQSVEELIEQSMNMLCPETERSVSQSLLQQFSTPLNVAWMMNLLARLDRTSVILDPSAGTGTLLCFRRFFTPCLTIANEISPLRKGLLDEFNLDYCHKEDAEHIHFMPKFHHYGINRIIMNPPFSRSHLMGSKKNILAGVHHIIAAYDLLASGGRIVLLINDNFSQSSKRWQYFLSQVDQPHIPINASIDPRAFKTKGTLFPTRVIVIDKADDSAPLYQQDTIDLNNSINYLKSI